MELAGGRTPEGSSAIWRAGRIHCWNTGSGHGPVKVRHGDYTLM